MNGSCKQRGRSLVLVAAGVLLAGAFAGASAPGAEGAASGGTTTRVSVSSTGQQADAASFLFDPAISGDGRYVAFVSSASDLVAGDTNGVADIFLRDRWSGVTRRVSVGPSSRQPDGASDQPSISADGRFVTYSSRASNLVDGDTNDAGDVFVRDRWTGVTQLVSVGPDALQANDGSGGPVISRNGRYIAFGSAASNLVAGDTNDLSDIFISDRTAGVTRRLSISTAGEQTLPSPFYLGSSGPAAISADGHHVAFLSSASNLVPDDTNNDYDVFLRDEARGRLDARPTAKSLLSKSRPTRSQP